MKAELYCVFESCSLYVAALLSVFALNEVQPSEAEMCSPNKAEDQKSKKIRDGFSVSSRMGLIKTSYILQISQV